jgi:ribosomal-protein-alanine N-acetyltransferase
MYSMISVIAMTNGYNPAGRSRSVRTRSASVDDLPALMALEEGAFGPRRWTKEFVRHLMEDPQVHTLVVEDGGLIAYTMYSTSPAYETVELLSLAVSPKRRRQGLGRWLMDLMEKMARDDGAQTIMLCVRPDNREAIDLYLSRGYKVLARCDRYYEDGSDADMMVKHLED